MDYAVEHGVKRFVFLSSVEIYGENRGDVDVFGEEYLGYIDCNTLRSGYPEGKRLGESMCNAYAKQQGIDFVIPRLSRTYGPGLLDTGSVLTLSELAGILADIAGTKVIFELPDEVEKAGYSTATKAVLDASKLEALGWSARVHMREGLERMVKFIT